MYKSFKTVLVILGLVLVVVGISLVVYPEWLAVPGGLLVLLGFALYLIANIGSALANWQIFLHGGESERAEVYNTSSGEEIEHLENRLPTSLSHPPSTLLTGSGQNVQVAISTDSEYKTNEVRQLLLASVNEQELREIIADHFPEVKSNIGVKFGLREIVDTVLDYCVRHGKVGELVDMVAMINPHRYRLYKSKLKG